MKKSFKIGILDSGKGGYYALLDIKSHFPQYDYETYLDYVNAPYGNKSSEEIYTLTEVGCLELWGKGCQLILIACNTICAETMRKLQDKYSDKKILGCIIPSVEVATEISQGKIGLIGTKFTVNSGKYQKEIAKLSDSHKLFALATPELAGYVEDGISHHPETLIYLDRYIGELMEKDIDTLILACTHYTVYYEYLTIKYPHLKIVDSARTQTIKLGEYLQKHSELFL
ncbi:aspartate/glutamate racemase family protein [Candidatus Gracilibacteria bacterium]|nr:aspartate/glutamate racemase family protein [Candidatus Gracilibacteria bacterium]